MEKERVLQFYNSHRGAINGALTGFFAATFILIVGLFRMLFIAMCVGVGYYIGKRLSEDKDYVKNLLDKFLPPGTYR